MISKLVKRRLLKLCDYMESLPKSANEHFDMRAYIKHDGDHTHKIPKLPTQEDLHTCGTTACALGWVVASPYFRRMGLKLGKDWMGKPEVKGTKQAFGFDLFSDRWERLFGPYNRDRTTQAWAKRVRKYIEANS